MSAPVCVYKYVFRSVCVCVCAEGKSVTVYVLLAQFVSG